jgi:integrase
MQSAGQRPGRPASGQRATSRLTERRIEALRPEPGAQFVVWDGALPGFGVRVSPAGARAFVLKYRLPSGRVRWKTLGRVGAIALTKARRDAKDDIGRVARGEDPLETRDGARQAVTLGDAADRFLEDHVDARRKPATQRLYRLVIDGHLRPRFGTTAIADLNTDDIVKLHHRLRSTPYLANRVVAVTSKLMNWAATAGYRGKGPHVNPCDGIEKFREAPRKRYLTAAELKRLGAALRVGKRRHAITPSALVAIRLLLFTGARVSEILSLQWPHVDLRRGALNLPDSKTGAKVVLLSQPAVDVLKEWPRHAGTPFVFPGEGHGTRKGQHRVSLVDAWAWIRARAKIADVRLHDLRHSYASVAASSGQSLPMIGALLGHAQAATTQRYAHLMIDPLRAASDATAATIAAGLSRKPR